MANPLVECIANYSDARRPQVIEAIMQSILSVKGVSLLDRHSDLDHNRTVLTFVGPPEQVVEAAYRSIARAAELINLDEHSGEHPRIGASDVVPFVPIREVTMEECVALARRLGQRVGEQLGIPVYLYEEAATRPERQNLENVRRGQYEGLKEEIQVRPERQPDFGPSRLGTAGATVIGARHPLIAFNVYLTTDDVSIAKKIAKAVRHSTGGLRYVKGLGMLVDGRAQVSMNLTNYQSTPLARVVELIRREAGRYGVGVHHSELVGLIPQQALVDAAVWYMQMDQFEPGQILEYRIAEAEHEKESLAPVSKTGFLDDLASVVPAPGGGSAAAYSGAAAAALAAMVARLTIGRKKYLEVEPQMQAILERAETLRQELTRAIDRDAQAFDAVMAAFKLPKESEQDLVRRSQAIEQSTLHAARVPLEVAEMSVEAMDLTEQVTRLGNINAVSDGATGAGLARAALTGAGYNVRINLKDMHEHAEAAEMMARLVRLEERANDLEARVRAAFSQRGGVVLP